jgi:hypothetical protein
VGLSSHIEPFLLAQAEHRCEYCHFPIAFTELPFEVDHIIAKKHGGGDEAGNLAVSCFYCNSYKGPNIAGIDPETSEIVRLFHPRHDVWALHFQWDYTKLIGLTASGRATIQVLCMNHPDAIAVRDSLLREGVFTG